MWVMVLLIAVVVVYGYVIGLSLWARRVQLNAARIAHHPHDHSAMSHVTERNLHGYIARILIASLSVRLLQLLFDVTPWLLVPLTILWALWTWSVTAGVFRMALEDFHNWYIGGLNRVKTVVLLVCAAAILADQVWRVITLFWFRSN